MRKVYDAKIDSIDTLKEKLNLIKKGSKIKWKNERNRFICVARNDRFVIVIQNFNLKKDTYRYSILDTKEMICNKDNMIFGIYDYSKESDCEKALDSLQDEDSTFEISYRGRGKLKEIITEIWCED